MSDYLVTMTIDGAPPSMKNSRRLVRNRKTLRPMSIKSANALAYEEAFMAQVPPGKRIGYDGPVSVRCRVWYPSRRQDLDIEFICDLLQRAGVIQNDRQVMHKEAFKGYDRERPRVHLTVAPYREAAE